MSNTVYRARHREQRSALAPIAAFAANATSNVAQVSRRSAAVVLTTGIVAGLTAAPASAEQERKPLSIDATNFVDASKGLIEAAPVVTVAADGKWSEEKSKIKVTPAPEPIVVRQVERAASRTSERTALTGTGTNAAAASTTTQAAPAQAAPKPAAPPASAAGSAVIEIASRYVGVPYVSGGATPSGFDCSGFTSYVFAQLGISLPRTSGAQRSAGTVVSRSEARAGDLIWTPGHISIYAGGNTQIDAPRPGKTIQFRSIWQSNPTFIRIG